MERNKKKYDWLLIFYYYKFMNFAVIGLGSFGIKRATAIKKSKQAKPVILMGDSINENNINFLESGGAFLVGNSQEIHSTISDLKNIDYKKVKLYLEKTIFSNDGSSHIRVTDLIISLCKVA